uniref:Uncharacterized protein n=1 Tax=Anguilla anguilla TaxID=7936 RepID=A0A0E9V6J4_ANGAN
MQTEIQRGSLRSV